MIIDDPVRLSSDKISIRLHTALFGAPSDALVFGAPSIDWDFTITIDTSGPSPQWTLKGKWDGFPAVEIYINNQPIYTFDVGTGPYGARDLLKLYPGLADVQVAPPVGNA